MENTDQEEEAPVGAMCLCVLTQYAKKENGNTYKVQGNFEVRYKYLGKKDNLWKLEDTGTSPTEIFLVNSEYIRYFKAIRPT